MTETAAEHRKKIVAWALYDFGNSAFATTVMAGFFPLFFKQYWSAGSDVSQSTWNLGVANAVASLLVVFLAPVLGALADQGRKKKRLLASFAALGCSMTFGLYFVGKGDWTTAAMLYAGASLGFAGSLIFYDSLLVSVATPQESDRVSALGYSFGYLGGGLLFTLNVCMTLKPEWFGFADKAAGLRASFVTVAVWWAAFTIPLLRRVQEPEPTSPAREHVLRNALREVRSTLARIRKMPNVCWFLAAYFLYIDGIDTIIRMAVDYGLSLGLPDSSLIIALLITQFVGFPSAILYGRLAGKLGAKRGILIGIFVYFCVTIFGYFMQTATHFYVLAIVIGLIQGGVQALSRSLYSRLIPVEEAGEFFGFYNMLGKFSAIIGPLMMGGVSLMTGSARLSILSITGLFIAGGALLLHVDEHAPRARPD